MRATTALVAAFLMGLFGCASPGGLPDWALRRPVEPGFVHGVGTCGATREPETARKLAIERAAGEIWLQVRGPNTCSFELIEEAENGEVAVAVEDGDRSVGRLDGARVVAAETVEPSTEGFAERTVIVLLRAPLDALH